MNLSTTVGDIIKLAPQELKVRATMQSHVVVKVQTPIGPLTFSKDLLTLKMVDY